MRRSSKLHLVAYQGWRPEIMGTPAAARAAHALVGRLTLGGGAWLGAGAVIRADGHYVRIGAHAHFGRGATVHIAHDHYPTVVHERVSVGANAVVHACTVRADVVIEDDCVVLDGAQIGAGAVLEAASVVFPRSVLAGGMLYAGRPARALRALEPGEAAARAAALRARNEAADAAWPRGAPKAGIARDAFVADTACLQGDVRIAAGASVWYGCRLDARAGRIALGAHCNVQDNSVLVAGAGGLAIGAETTIGHNVQLAECRIGARCLVGMGSRIAAGSVIADDTFVAAGCVTAPGQVLEGGRVWGGEPARPIGTLDDLKRETVRLTAVMYSGYAREFRAACSAA
ncbi:MAG: gamma carbonic anhydrase family protein [Proteobacteria bacterium]|nr:gamma carbonic anhydrase family protein [Pseudomonadota bacterium]